MRLINPRLGRTRCVEDIDHCGLAFVSRVLAVDEEVPLLAWTLGAFECRRIRNSTL